MSLHRDIVENIIIHSDMKEVEMLCMSSKEIGNICNDRRIRQILIKKHRIKLFKDVNTIHSCTELIEAYKIYKHYERQGREIVDFATKYDRYMFIDLNMDFDLKANLLDFINQTIRKASRGNYGTGTEIPEYLMEINFDFKNGLMVLLYEDHNIITYKGFTWTKGRHLHILTQILYYYPTVDLKLGYAEGGQPVHPTYNIRTFNIKGDEVSMIRENIVNTINHSGSISIIEKNKDILNKLNDL